MIVFARLAFCFLVLCLSACQQNPPATVLNTSDIQNEIQMMTDSFHRAIHRSGFEAEFHFLDSSEQFFWVIPGETQPLYYDSIAALITQNAKNFNQVNLHWSLLNIHVLSQEIASYNGIVEGTMHQIANDSIVNVSILESGNLIKRAGGWKFLCGQSRNN